MKISVNILLRGLFIAAVLCCSVTEASAQFTLKKDPENKYSTMPSAPDMSGVELQKNFHSSAADNYRRRLLRRERNTVEFNSSLETSLQQFENWTGSGTNNFYVLTSIFFRHQYKKDKLTFDTKLDAAYGMNFIDDALFKNKDEFKINSQMGWALQRGWSYSTSVNLRSQFAKGYKSRTEKIMESRFMAPGYFDIAVGFTYAPKKIPFKVTLSPIAGNIVTVFDSDISELGKYGVPKGSRLEGWLGPSAEVFYDQAYGKKEIFRYRSNLYLFIPYRQIGSPTVRWENTLEIKLSRYISTKLYGQLYYREQDSSSLQYQYSFMIGLKYVFKNKS